MSRTSILVVGLLLLVLNLPLVFRMVPMNRWYGFRTEVAFRSDRHWYDLNAHGGKVLALWSLVIIATGAIGFWLPPEQMDRYRLYAPYIVIGSVVAALVQFGFWARRYTP